MFYGMLTREESGGAFWCQVGLFGVRWGFLVLGGAFWCLKGVIENVDANINREVYRCKQRGTDTSSKMGRKMGGGMSTNTVTCPQTLLHLLSFSQFALPHKLSSVTLKPKP
jgi:hypothetical protein